MEASVPLDRQSLIEEMIRNGRVIQIEKCFREWRWISTFDLHLLEQVADGKDQGLSIAELHSKENTTIDDTQLGKWICLVLLNRGITIADYLRSLMKDKSTLTKCVDLKRLVSRGQLESLKRCVLHYGFEPFVGESTIKEAIEANRPDILSFLLSVASPSALTVELCAVAAKMGKVSLLKLLRKARCPWNCKVVKIACLVKSALILEYALDNGCEAPLCCLLFALHREFYSGVELLYQKRFSNENLSPLYVLGIDGFYVERPIICSNCGFKIPRIGADLQISVVKWLRNRKVPWESNAISCILNYYQYRTDYRFDDLLQFMVNSGCPYNTHDAFELRRMGIALK